MPENKSNFVLELKPCDRCGNAFMVKKGDIKPDHELVCDNCIKLEERKKKLMLGVFDKVIEVENKMEDSINEMKSVLNVAKGKFNKQFFLKQIKQRAETLKKSIELVEKIEATNDEKFFEEYVSLFEKIKKENID
jgi:DNA-directed RNA polymerase subunit M/transcription elongation factor TFIIS